MGADVICSLPTAIIGGGPAGSVAALCLRKLGCEVELFEKARFPRYRVGESLLPGTLSILKRLGVFERVEAAGFVKKPAATFLWGGDRAPWTFSFATPKTAPWVFDYGLQVNRDKYDQILLDAARDAGAVVHEECEVTSVDPGTRDRAAEIQFRGASGGGSRTCAFVVDASGTRGVVAQARGLRRSDAYFRNIALWSYFRGGKRFTGDLAGNVFSVTFDEGWIWIIPLKDDVYSVGVVTGAESAEEIQRLGSQAFYEQSIAGCSAARDILATAEQTAEIRVVKEWSYDSEALTVERAFLCGDAACFVDPLFSQGVHLATYSAMLAAAGIGHLLENAEDYGAVRRWYEESYRAVYGQYHKFLCAFYSDNEQPDSRFWSSRKIAGNRDERIQGAEWLATLTGGNGGGAANGSRHDEIKHLEEGASLLATLWRHSEQDLDAGVDEKGLALRRVRWASGILKDLKKTRHIRWAGERVDVVSSFEVGRESFRLKRRLYLADPQGHAMTAHPVTAAHRELFESLIAEPLHYDVLASRLGKIDGRVSPLEMIMRLIEDGLLEVVDKGGESYRIPRILRFAGVGGHDSFS